MFDVLVQIPMDITYQSADKVNGVYLKPPQMSPNTSSLFVCVLLSGVDDPPTLVPVDPPHISLPKAIIDGC